MQLKTFCPYQVGDIYLTTAANDPTALWPGTSWQALQDCVLMAAGSVYAAGSTGGSATHSHTTGDCTLTTNQIPSHAHTVPTHGHSFTQPTVPAHNHGLNSHTHTYSKTNTPVTGGSHSHTLSKAGGALVEGGVAGNSLVMHMANNGPNVAQTDYNNHAYVLGSTAGGASERTTKTSALCGSTDTSSSHSHTLGFTSTNSGAPSTTNTADKAAFACTGGSVTDKAAFDTNSAGGGTEHNHGNTGSGSSLPPYLAVYMWKRVA